MDQKTGSPFVERPLHKLRISTDSTQNQLKRHREPQSGAAIQGLPKNLDCFVTMFLATTGYAKLSSQKGVGKFSGLRLPFKRLPFKRSHLHNFKAIFEND